MDDLLNQSFASRADIRHACFNDVPFPMTPVESEEMETWIAGYAASVKESGHSRIQRDACRSAVQRKLEERGDLSVRFGVISGVVIAYYVLSIIWLLRQLRRKRKR